MELAIVERSSKIYSKCLVPPSAWLSGFQAALLGWPPVFKSLGSRGLKKINLGFTHLPTSECLLHRVAFISSILLTDILLLLCLV